MRERSMLKSFIFGKLLITQLSSNQKCLKSQNNKFVLPDLKYNPTNYYSFQNTQNQQKRAKKNQSKNQEKCNYEGDEDLFELEPAKSNQSLIKMTTRNKKQEEQLSGKQSGKKY
ncbi:hypothetical protein OXYTRIMIC_700 [Oxytricha trifallax]|uniref:Uncharacterized protein n=1 Tax=Oxytricha trifallax TaxID=1172189 RepID=A0A073I0B8_9SPIT|nr:hypothetical protein OXYTRIMIC_700 [Oxytricha trifallax]